MMGQLMKSKELEKFSPNELLDATYLASKNFQVRAFFEAKEDIIKVGKYNEEEFYNILDALIDAETERQLVLKKLKSFKEPLTIEKIIKKFKEIDPINLIRDIFYLKEQGYVEEVVEVKTKVIKKTVDGEEKEIEQKEYIYRYQVKNMINESLEHYFEPVSLVYENGVCCNCGWCSAICPVNAISVSSDNLEIDEEKCFKCGLCFSVCPRSFSIDRFYESISKVDKSLQFSKKIGAYINTYSGSTSTDEIKKVCQDGGVVTSLLEYLLNSKKVDAIVAVEHSDELWNPKGVIIDNVEDLYKTAGTKYANCASLSVLDKAKDFNSIAVVGVPCMMKAIEKGSFFPSGHPFFNNIKYKIGLFCMESFSYENIIKLVKEKFEKEIDEVVKMNIDKGKFIINLKNGEELTVPLKEIQSYARDTCHYCEDLTSDYADISVGSIGSQAGWSSVITRTQEGEELYKAAIEEGLLESKKLTEVKPGQFLVEKIAGIKRNKCKSIELKET